jgi:hemerythrin
MAFLDWSDNYLTGIAKIDSDHRNLFLIINVLHDHVHDSEKSAEVFPVLAALGEYVTKHFNSEEQIMRNANYPGYNDHVQVHRAIAIRVQTYIDQCNNTSSDVDMDDLLRFLKDWLVNHVLESDMAYVPYVNNSNGQTS